MTSLNKWIIRPCYAGVGGRAWIGYCYLWYLDFLRPADVGAEALAGARAIETGGEAGSDLLNPLAKGVGEETQAGRDLLGGFDFGGDFRRPLEAPPGRIFSPGEAGSDLFNPLAKEGEEIGSDLENPLAKDLEKGSRLRNTLLKISKYGTIGAIGIGGRAGRGRNRIVLRSL